MNYQKICGTTKITGLLGNPVAHSISPLIHNHAFASLGLDYVYVPLGCGENDLDTLVHALRGIGFAGANVTIPFKSKIIPLCDSISPLSEMTGTVNTLSYSDGKLHGTTTDGAGFLRALDEDNFHISRARVVILGNGGTARTLAMVLAHESPVSDIVILGRRAERAAALADEIRDKTGFPVRSNLLHDHAGRDDISRADLLVNCTPVGMHPQEDALPVDAECLSKRTYVFDAIYNPVETQLLAAAQKKGCPYQNGLLMLLYQGLESFYHWTGRHVSASLFPLPKLQKMVSRNI
ncbi:MAG: shikimate dehydrogenase [Fibrobacterota bacterium]